MTETRSSPRPMAADYVSAFQKNGSEAFVANLTCHLDLLDWGSVQLPIAIRDGSRSRAFVCSPRTTYVDYVLEELNRFPGRVIAPVLKGIVLSALPFILAAQMDRAVFVNDWLLSTNLVPALDHTRTQDVTTRLCARFPHHVLAFRSLRHGASSPLMASLVSAGWRLLPSRQVYLAEDVETQMMPRRDVKQDRKLLRTTKLTFEVLKEIDVASAQRIAELYAMLYLEKYSKLNPAFTPAFVRLTQSLGLLRYFVFRSATDRIDAFGAVYRSDRQMTMPLIGHDTKRPAELGLYRLVAQAGAELALQHGLCFNLSSGAARFKLTRGACSEMEYTAYFTRHLGLSRRIAFGVVENVARRIGEPVLRAYAL